MSKSLTLRKEYRGRPEITSTRNDISEGTVLATETPSLCSTSSSRTRTKRVKRPASNRLDSVETKPVGSLWLGSDFALHRDHKPEMREQMNKNSGGSFGRLKSRL